MPMHFDRFRFLNDSGKKLRNEGTHEAFVLRGDDDPDPIPVPPGAEVELPEAPELILEVKFDEPSTP